MVAVEAMEARHDAEIAGIVEALHRRARVSYELGTGHGDAYTSAALAIATTHAAALARHAGRNTTEAGRDPEKETL